MKTSTFSMPSLPIPDSCFLREVHQTPVLSREEERRLAERVVAGDGDAREAMIRANLRMVMKIARQYLGCGMTLEDLVQEGTIGLVRAVERFDPSRGLRFCTYAKFWIVQAIMKAIKNTGRLIHVPGYAVSLARKWERLAARMQEENGVPPSEAEVARRLGVTAKQRRIIKKALHLAKNPPQPDHDSEDRPLWETIQDPREKEPHLVSSSAEDVAKVRRLLDRLDSRAATVLRLRYGLDGDDPMKLSEIGRELFLTRERVRQLAVKALSQLRKQMEGNVS